MLKKITQSFLTLLLLMVAGVAYGQKPTEVANLSKDMYHRWVGVEADATIADPDAPDGDVKLNTETDCPYGNTGVVGQDFADLTAWDYLTLVVTSDNPRLFFNDSSVGGGRLTVATANASDPYVENKGDGVYVINLAAIKEARAFVHLNAIKASSWNTKANVAEMKLAKGAPYIPVKVEVADLSKDMYHRWVGVEADATIADPDAPDGDVKLNTETDCPYGNTGVVGQDFADLTAWDYLTLVVTSDNPRLFFNDSSVGGGRLTVATANASDPYVENKGDGVYVINLAAIKEARAFVHLNAIKASSWNTKAVVEEMKLATGEAYLPAAKYDITVAAGIENGTVAVKDGLKKAAEGAKVTLTITPAEGYELDALSVLAGETAVQVAADNTFTMPAAAVTVSATFKEKQGGEEQGAEAKVADLNKDKYHMWTGYDAEATIADPDNPNCAYDLNKETGCVYGNSNINAGTATQFADLGDWDYLTIVVASDNPRLFFNQNDANNILVYANDANYVVSNENGVIIYDLAKFKADKGFVHLNAIKASAYNTQVNITEMKLATVKPYIPVNAEVADLDKDKYHLWTGYDAEAAIADPDNPNCAYDLNKETGCVYGNSNINAGTATQFADLGDWDYLTIVVASDNPRLFFNQNDANNILVYANDANYVVSNENGVIIYDLAKFKADKGFVHLNAIKASSWNTQVNVEEMKLATVEAYIPATKYDITIADGIENGTVAVKGGLKKAAEGDEVTLEATPVVTYELKAFSVTYNDGNEDKDVEVSAEGVFTMPAFPVTVSATFVESATPITPDAWFVADNFRVVDYKGKEDGGRIEKDDQGKNIREIPRFELEDKTTGNGSIVVTTDNNAGEDYWSQFWMKVCDEPMAEGATPLALSFRIRADRAQTIATQGHGVDWEYNNASNGYLGFGKLDVTTEWQKVTLKVEAGNGHPTNFVSVVLNLSEKNGTSNNFYIDDVQVEEYKADWYYAQEIRAKDYLDPAATYTDTDTPHPLANYVAEGGYVQVVSNASPSQPYNSQIWIQIPDEWVGKTTKMTFEVMADQVVSAPESYQATATGKGWGANAAPSASAKLEITEQDKWITIERILNTENVKSNAGAPYSSRQVDQYCVDLSNNTDPITYKFRNVKFEEYVPTYAITITEAENGSVSANVTEAAEGAKVTLTITPAEGYELDALSVAAGETPVEVAEDNSFTMPAAAVTVTATFKAVESGEEEYLPKPETDPDYADFEEIAQDQGKDLDTFARTAVEEGADFNTYTASGDLQVAFKMYDIDVKDCDYVTVKFAQPAPKGWNIAFWAQGGTDNVEIPEGATEYKYVFADDTKCAIKDDVLPQICVLTLWPGGYPFDMKVYGIYKHKATATAIEGVETAEDAVKDGKYFINGQIVIVKNGVKYNAAGVAIK